MSDLNDTPEKDNLSVTDTIVERAVVDESFREQLLNDFDAVTKEYNLTPADIEALSEAYNGLADAGFVEVLDDRANPVAAVDMDISCCSCCCCPSCCCA